MSDPVLLARDLKLMVFDVDGVMTDGRITYSEDGAESKSFHTLDGHGVKMLQDGGVMTAILTARRSRIVERRARELGIAMVRQGTSEKLAGWRELLHEAGVDAQHAGYMGDDVMDLPVLRRCRFAATVPDAPEVIHRHAHWTSQSSGGHGAVREVCEFILRAQGRLDKVLTPYLA